MSHTTSGYRIVEQSTGRSVGTEYVPGAYTTTRTHMTTAPLDSLTPQRKVVRHTERGPVEEFYSLENDGYTTGGYAVSQQQQEPVYYSSAAAMMKYGLTPSVASDMFLPGPAGSHLVSTNARRYVAAPADFGLGSAIHTSEYVQGAFTVNQSVPTQITDYASHQTMLSPYTLHPTYTAPKPTALTRVMRDPAGDRVAGPNSPSVPRLSTAATSGHVRDPGTPAPHSPIPERCGSFRLTQQPNGLHKYVYDPTKLPTGTAPTAINTTSAMQTHHAADPVKVVRYTLDPVTGQPTAPTSTTTTNTTTGTEYHSYSSGSTPVVRRVIHADGTTESETSGANTTPGGHARENAAQRYAQAYQHIEVRYVDPATHPVTTETRVSATSAHAGGPPQGK